MTDSAAAMMIRDMIKDCMEEAEPAHPGGDTSYGSMLIEGEIEDLEDAPLALPGTAGFGFTQAGVRFFVHVLAVKDFS